MADNVLGIAGLVDIDDIQKTFDALISQLDRVGVTTDNLSERMTKALSDIAKSTDKDLATKAREAMAVLKDTIQEANESLGDTPAVIEGAKKKVEDLEKSCAKLEAQLEKTTKECNGTPISSKEFKELNAEIDGLNKQLDNNREALSSAKERVSDLEATYSTAQSVVDQMQAKYDSFSQSIKENAKALENEASVVDDSEKSGKGNASSIEAETSARKENTEAIKNETEAIKEQKEASQTAGGEGISNMGDSGLSKMKEDADKAVFSLAELAAKSKEFRDELANIDMDNVDDGDIDELTAKFEEYQALTQQTADAAAEAYQKQSDYVGELTARVEELSEKLDSGADAKGLDSVRDEYASLCVKLGDANEILTDLNEAKEAATVRANDAADAISKWKKEIKDICEDLEEEKGKVDETKESINGFGDDVKQKSPRQQLMELRNEITRLTLSYREMSTEEQNSAKGQALKNKIEQLQSKAAQLKDAFDDVQESIKNEANDVGAFKGITQGLNLVISGFATAQGAAAAFGVSEEELVRVQTVLQTSLAATNFLTEAGTALQKQSALMVGIRSVQEKFAAWAIGVRTAAEGKGIVATKAAIVVQKIFNAVAKANPYVLLAMAILTVVGALATFIIGTKEGTEAEKEQQKAIEENTAAMKMAKAELSGYGNSLESQLPTYNKLQEQWKRLSSDMEKRQFLKDAKTDFNKLGVEINNIKDAEDFLIRKSKDVVTAFNLRAKAAGAAAAAAALYKNALSDVEIGMGIGAVEAYGEIDYNADPTGNTWKTIGLVNWLMEKGISREEIENHIGQRPHGEYRQEDNAFEIKDKQAAKWLQEYRLEQAEADAKDYAKIQVEALEEADKLLAQYKPTGTTPTTAPVLKSAQELSDELLRIRKETVDRQLAIEKEGSDRWIELEKRRIELQAEIDRRAVTSSGNKALKNLDDSYRGGKSGLTEEQYHEQRVAIEGQVSQQIQAINVKAADDLRAIDDGRAQRLNELLEPYKTLAQQRLEIEKKYDDDLEKIRQARRETEASLANAQTDDEKKELQKRLDNIISAEAQATTNKGKELAGFDLDVLKQNPAYIRAFEDLNNTSSETLTQLIALFEKAKTGAAQSLNPEDLKEYTEALQSMYDVLADRKPFDAVSDTKKQLSETTSLLNTAKIRLEQVKNGEKVVKSLRMEDNKLVATYWTEAEAQEEVNRLLDEQTKKRNQYNKALKNALSKVDELAQAIASVGDAMGGTAGEALGLISNVMTFVTSTIDGITACAQTGAQALSAIEKASVILTIISAAIQLFQKISSLYKDAHAQYEEFAAKQKEINQLRDAVNDYTLAVIEATNAEKRWFDSTGLASLRDMYEYSNQALESYIAKMYEAQAIYQNESGGGWLTSAFKWIVGAISDIVSIPGKLITGALDKMGILDKDTVLGQILDWGITGLMTGGAGLDFKGLDAYFDSLNYEEGTTAAFKNLRIETRSKSSGFLGTGIGGHSQRTEDLVEWVKANLGEDLFGSDGFINVELANTVLDKYGDKLVGETKATLEELIRLKEEYDKFREQLEDYVSQMFSPLTSDMVDALWDWLKDGKDVMDSFKKYASDTFAEIAREMVKQALLTKIFDGFQDKLANLYEVYAAGGIDEKMLADGVMQATDALLDNAEKGLPAIQNLLTYIDEKFKERGFDITGSDSEVYQQQGSSGAWQSLGEDTGRELNGRFTALQITGESILVQVIEQTNILVAIQQDITTTRIAVVDINANVGRLIEAQNTANGHLEAISKNTYQLYEMRDDIKEIVKKVKNV